jgi:glutathione S-transferase
MLELITINELAPNLSPLIRHNFGIVQATEQALTQAQDKINIVLTYLEKELGSQTYFCGEQFTLVEAVLGTITPLLPSIGVSLTPYPQLARWTKNLLERESWQKTQATPEQIESFQASMKKLLTPKN